MRDLGGQTIQGSAVAVQLDLPPYQIHSRVMGDGDGEASRLPQSMFRNYREALVSQLVQPHSLGLLFLPPPSSLTGT